MRITDLLSASSIDLNAKPLNKKEAIEQAVKLMAVILQILKRIRSRLLQEKKKAQLVLERELPYHTANAVR
mgnify:CR=1 FL=1